MIIPYCAECPWWCYGECLNSPDVLPDGSEACPLIWDDEEGP